MKSPTDPSYTAKLVPEMAKELGLSMSQFLATCNSKKFMPIPTYGYVYSMVLAVSSRVFVGQVLARDKEWLDTISASLAKVANAL